MHASFLVSRACAAIGYGNISPLTTGYCGRYVTIKENSQLVDGPSRNAQVHIRTFRSDLAYLKKNSMGIYFFKLSTK